MAFPVFKGFSKIGETAKERGGGQGHGRDRPYCCRYDLESRRDAFVNPLSTNQPYPESGFFYCASFAHAPRQIVRDIDDTFDTVHGHQQLRLFNACYDEYGFQPIVVFDGEGRLVGAVLRPAQFRDWSRSMTVRLVTCSPRYNSPPSRSSE